MSVADLMVPGQPLWTGAVACYPYSPALAKRLTLLDRFDAPFTLYRQVGDKIMVPRALCPIGVQDLRQRGLPVSFTGLKFKPRDNQVQPIADAISLLKNDQSFILRAPTGWGKTDSAMPMIQAVGRLPLVVVPREGLVTRWRQAFVEVLGIKPHEVGLMQGDVMAVAGKKAIIAMLQSLYKDKYPNWVKQHVGFMIFDEVHRIGAEEFCKAVDLFPAMLRLGLSAREERRDGRDIVFRAHIGPTRVKAQVSMVPLRVFPIASGWVCPRKKDGSKIAHSAGKDQHVKVILSKNTPRNSMIVRAIKKLYDKGRNIVVFSEFTAHIETLRDACHLAGIPVFDVSTYFGAMTDRASAEALSKRVIIATYGKMAEGIDVPCVDAIVLATPRADVLQPVGRGRRLLDGKEHCIVVDFVDDDSHVFRGYGRSRIDWYTKEGADIVRGISV